MPIGGVLISEPIYQAMLEQSRKIGTFGHGFTYSGHPVCAAVALRALEIYDEDDIAGHVAAMASPFAARIAELATHPLVGHGRAVGLVGAIELMADAERKAPFDPSLRVGARVVEWALEYGVVLRPLGDVISFCPPLIIDRAETEFLFHAVSRALDRVASELPGGAQAPGRLSLLLRARLAGRRQPATPREYSRRARSGAIAEAGGRARCAGRARALRTAGGPPRLAASVLASPDGDGANGSLNAARGRTCGNGVPGRWRPRNPSGRSSSAYNRTTRACGAASVLKSLWAVIPETLGAPA